MKNKKHIHYFIAVTLALVGIANLQSCSKKLDDAYLNPNNPVEGAIEAILPNVINQMTSTAAPPTGGGGGSYGPATDAVNLAKYIQWWGTNTSANLESPCNDERPSPETTTRPPAIAAAASGYEADDASGSTS